LLPGEREGDEFRASAARAERAPADPIAIVRQVEVRVRHAVGEPRNVIFRWAEAGAKPLIPRAFHQEAKLIVLQPAGRRMSHEELKRPDCGVCLRPENAIVRIVEVTGPDERVLDRLDLPGRRARMDGERGRCHQNGNDQRCEAAPRRAGNVIGTPSA